MVIDGRAHPLGEMSGRGDCDLELVDSLLRLVLELRRAGARLMLHDVQPDLRALLDLIGLAAEVVADGPVPPAA